MENSPISSNPSSVKAPSKIWVLVLLVFLGLTDASYLAFSHYAGLPIACGSSASCNIVTTSSYAYFLGLPLGLWGVFYYGILLVLGLLWWDRQKAVFGRLFAGITALGVIASLWFVYVQVFIIKAICLYCMVSAITTTILFVVSASFVYKISKNKVS